VVKKKNGAIGKVIAVCSSQGKGTRKQVIPEGELKTNFGMVGDAHASSTWHRQVSLLAIESIDKMRQQGFKVNPGDFAENLTCKGVVLTALPIGTKIRVGKDVLLRISQIGKECHTGCAVFKQAGVCVMPKEGVFAEVLRGGKVRANDEIMLADKDDNKS
jgi:molybdopterin adenylyltransferase